MFSVKQDVRLLNENVVRSTLTQPLRALIDKRGLRQRRIDWFLPHMSSNYFARPIELSLQELGLDIPRERWFSNLCEKGNTGSASPFIMLDELFRRVFEKGRKLGRREVSGHFKPRPPKGYQVITENCEEEWGGTRETWQVHLADLEIRSESSNLPTLIWNQKLFQWEEWRGGEMREYGIQYQCNHRRYCVGDDDLSTPAA